jgi:hypothetical protein
MPMRELLDKLTKAASTTAPYILQTLTEAKLEESHHPMAAHFAPLEQALTMFDNAKGIVCETMHTFMKVEAIKLSKQYPGSYVLLSGGMGTLNVWIYPSAEYAAELDAMLDSGDVYEEDRALEFQGFINGLNDPYAKPAQRFLPFHVNDQLAKQYGIDAWELGEVAFLNGQETTVQAVRAHAKTLSSFVQKMSQGG